ncbi:MAG: beta-hexosaminidase precursor, partial [Verrucomicrobiales bacterium]|nr:beta-hexosaminidase precursor [Verrucomicrobiales bacterium]
MVLLRFVVSLLILGSTLASESRASAEVVLAHAKHSAWVIAPTSTNVAGVMFAPEELQKYLRQMSGAKVPIVSKAARKTIVIGLRADLPADVEQALPPRKAGYDGYAISIREDGIVIAGDNGPGCIYGVYDLLEHLGCRWFYPTIDPKDPEVVPKLSTVLLTTNAWAIASPIRNRICNGDAWFFEMNYPAALKQMDWAMKNRYNAMGWQAAVNTSKRSLLQQYNDLNRAGITSGIEKRGMFIHGPAHSFDHFLKSEIYFAKHPEWFGMRNGKRVPQAALGAQFCW